ncbi:MAG: hypothetical protein IPJ00_10995 [Saprospirales bacterium]|nr:hypothetical protein [Saprospirales bacterium]
MRNLEERAKKPGNHKNSLDEFLRVLMQNDGPSIDADQDYFSQEIAGLGLDGPGAALPSPSGLKMIDQVNAGVHLYNGSQSTTIPLYTLSANDISIPVSLSSSSNGLKVNDLGSMAGQQWEINAGSMISRVVNGLPDEYSGTVGGIGVGRVPQITPRIQIPSGVGLRLEFTEKIFSTRPFVTLFLCR